MSAKDATYFYHRCDGKLSKQEVRHGYKEVFGFDLSDDDLDKLFDRGKEMVETTT